MYGEDLIRSRKINANIDACESYCLSTGWVLYFPLVAFQIHCLWTLYRYRNSVENLEDGAKVDPYAGEEQI